MGEWGFSLSLSLDDAFTRFRLPFFSSSVFCLLLPFPAFTGLNPKEIGKEEEEGRRKKRNWGAMGEQSVILLEE